jgi:flavin-dependent dehydrogenase
MNSEAHIRTDVVVIGGGLAGLASAIHLRRAGLKVICLEPVEHNQRIVGESLDWSAPELFAQLGFKMDDLVESGIATYKRHVILQLNDGSRAEYIPSEWLGKPPFHIELRTLHLDRVRLHLALQKLAQQLGVRFVPEAATSVERIGNRLQSVSTSSGTRYTAGWFIDASGSSASFLGRQLKLPYAEYGPKKVGIWSYASVKDWQEGTTLYTDTQNGDYFSWLWEIPIAPGKVSIGYVTTGASLKRQRSNGESVAGVFRRQLAKFDRFEPVLAEGNLEEPAVRSFQCRACKTACGPNWIIAGEAAAVPDPITGNGVTAALRHAAEGARLILQSRTRGTIPWHRRLRYNMRLSHMAKFFNGLIERLAYTATLRNRFGLLRTGDVYTALAWSMNHLYSRMRPGGMVGTAIFCSALSGLRALAWLAEQLVRLSPPHARFVPREAC